MEYLVILDTGNVSEPPYRALVKADSSEQAIMLACSAVTEEGTTSDDYCDIRVEQYEGGLCLKDSCAVAWLDSDY